MPTDLSYGIVPVKKKGHGWQVLLVQHSSALYWGFPKGHPEEGETPQEAAKRELYEETNLKVVRFFSDSSLKQNYRFKWQGQLIFKTVEYFVAEVSGTVRIQAEEIKSSQWLYLEEASDALTYDTDKAVCKEAMAFLPSQ